MAKEHGLSGLFDENGALRKDRADDASRREPAEPSQELPPVLEDAGKSPLELLAGKIGLAEGLHVPTPVVNGALRKERPHDSGEDPFGSALAAAGADETVAEDPPQEDPAEALGELPHRPVFEPRIGAERGRGAGGILCFLIAGEDERSRRRTLEALNVAAGNGAVRLRSLPTEPADMDRVLEEALSSTDCDYVAFLNAGTEPADDWALECESAFADAPRTAALSVRAANADPLSPWSRVAFFMDEVERQRGLSRGFDSMVFRASALRELREQLGPAIRNGRLVSALQGRGHRIGVAPEARVSIVGASDRREVMRHVREQARLAARNSAKRKNLLLRPVIAAAILVGYPFRILAVRKAAKESLGGTQFREVASKAAMAVFADRRVRAMTMLFPGKDRH